MLTSSSLGAQLPALQEVSSLPTRSCLSPAESLFLRSVWWHAASSGDGIAERFLQCYCSLPTSQKFGSHPSAEAQGSRVFAGTVNFVEERAQIVSIFPIRI